MSQEPRFADPAYTTTCSRRFAAGQREGVAEALEDVRELLPRIRTRVTPTYENCRPAHWLPPNAKLPR